MKAIIKFLQEVRTELIKVSWPSRQTVINLTLAVIGIAFVFTIFIGFVDYGFTEGIKYLSTAITGNYATATTPSIDLGDIEVDAGSGNIDIQPVTE